MKIPKNYKKYLKFSAGLFFLPGTYFTRHVYTVGFKAFTSGKLTCSCSGDESLRHVWHCASPLANVLPSYVSSSAVLLVWEERQGPLFACSVRRSRAGAVKHQSRVLSYAVC